MERAYIVHAAQLATPKGTTMRKGAQMADISVIPDGALYIEDGMIRRVGTFQDVHAAAGSDVEVIEAPESCVLPGFVDSHTHFLFGGYRAEEFVKRLSGVNYLDLLKAGGGIQSTVKSTRAAGFDQLYKDGLDRLDGMLAQGVTTVEGKSGYGLDLECELVMLRVLKKLNESHAVDIKPTYLGAHAVPEEWAGNADGYVDYMIDTVLPAVKNENLAQFCDVFCEDDVFSVEQSRKLLTHAKALSFETKIHADEIVSLGGAELAAEIGAVSADHLLMASEKGVKALANSNTVATLLPNTAFCLKKPYADARGMIDAGCAVALASDYNPGSCFSDSIPQLIALAVLSMGMTMEETFTALTLNGAAAIGCADQIGSLEPGKKADFLLLKFPDYRFLLYHTGMNNVQEVFKAGKKCFSSKHAI